MAVRIGSNILAVKLNRQLTDQTNELSRIEERLASGLRINKASDDAASLAILSGLETDARLFSQASRNISDGISYLLTADTTISQLKTIASRIRELAVQASNSTNSTSQLTALDTEADALREEFVRLAESSSFNGLHHFNLNNRSVVVQAGKNAIDAIDITTGQFFYESFTDNESGFTNDGTFSAPITYSLGDGVRDLAFADLNGDSELDIVSADFSGNSISVAFGNGNGSFKAPTSYVYTPGSGPNGISLVDVNNDSRIDIITADDGTDKVSVLINNGNGTFLAPVSYQAVTNPRDVHVTDINGDTFVDILTAGVDTGQGITISFGNGNGTFKAPTTFHTSGSRRYAEIIDFNNDGKLDIVSTGGGGPSYLGVMFGNGDGTFKSELAVNTGTNPEGLAIGDFNEDGILDVATSNQSSNTISIHISNGDGTFFAPTALTSNTAPYQIQTADINSDGFLDILGVDETSNTISLYQGNGDGTFKARVNLASAGGAPRSIELVDINGDDNFDIFVGNRTGDSVSVLLGNGNSSVSSSSSSGLFIPYFDLLTEEGQLEALEDLDQLDQILNAEHSFIGSRLSRLEAAYNYTVNMREVTIKSKSAIADADIASEVANMTRLRILQQSTTALLAQANLQAELVLKLITS